MSTGEIAAHFDDVYGPTVSKDTISRITDKVIEEMTEWCNRPLESGQSLTDVANPRQEMSDATWRTEPPTGTGQAVLLRTDSDGMPGAEAARRGGVLMSCGSLWFIDAGSVSITETRPISSRYINQDDRIEIADGLAAGEPVKAIAARIGKSFQSVYREIARNRKPDGTYQPWFAHNQAHLRRGRPRRPILDQQTSLPSVVAGKLAKRWSPEQISR